MDHELIRDVLLEHSRSSRNGLFPERYTYQGRLTNPLCGDLVEIRIQPEDEEVKDIGFKAQSCAICSASASLLTHEARGKNIKELLNLVTIFEQTIISSRNSPWPPELKNFIYFEHIRVTPSRKMCALLPWLVLKVAIKGT